MYDHQSPIQRRAIGQAGLHRKAPHGLSPSFITACLAQHRAPLRSQKWRSNAPNCPAHWQVGSGVLPIFRCVAAQSSGRVRDICGGSRERAALGLSPSARIIPTSSNTRPLNTSNSLYNICIISRRASRREWRKGLLSYQWNLPSIWSDFFKAEWK